MLQCQHQPFVLLCPAHSASTGPVVDRLSFTDRFKDKRAVACEVLGLAGPIMCQGKDTDSGGAQGILTESLRDCVKSRVNWLDRAHVLPDSNDTEIYIKEVMRQ